MHTDHARTEAEAQRAEVLALCGGNENAASLIDGFWRFCEVWDDAIDGDHKEDDATIHAGMMWALFDLNDNPFYGEHPQLRSALLTCIANWMTANTLERSGDRERVITAYTLRCSPYDFFVAVVLAASGFGAATKAALYFRGRATSDRLDDYLHEHLGG
jgi:hypothetical protein